MPWIIFLISTAFIIMAGTRLSRDGDRIADITGLGGVWIGAILVAGATSLPEIMTDVYAVRIGEENLALGTLFGSGMANMLILGVVDTLHRQRKMLREIAVNQSLLCIIAILVSAVATLGIAWKQPHSFLWIGWGAWPIAIAYVAGVRLLYQRPDIEKTTGPAPDGHGDRSALKRSVIGFSVAALVILFASRYLATSARDIAVLLGVDSGFIGLLMVGFTTSMPELVVSIAAVRDGAYDLAVGNLFGSNAFNMMIVILLDVVNGPSPILASASPDMILAGLLGISMMSVALMGVLYQAETRLWKLEPDTTLLIIIYLLGMGLLYSQGAL